MNNPPGSILEPIKLKISSQSYLSAKKKRRKGGKSHKKSALISKFQTNRKEGKSYLVGMEYCLFKREVEDDKILEEFLLKHSLECTESNVNTLREFAESSIESPIDFKSLIIRMKKKVKCLVVIYSQEEALIMTHSCFIIFQQLRSLLSLKMGLVMFTETRISSIIFLKYITKDH